ncbi:hypothetical protein ACHAWU_000837 [Discostella pseudostelligera]|uniref:Uncharacterized protein n=1 Tax=Discostella pseudostelligera TaxID=259834 RepID=A0ABD3M715_9STRA
MKVRGLSISYVEQNFTSIDGLWQSNIYNSIARDLLIGARDAEEESRLERATRFFLEQKYKLHHHPVHVSHSRYEMPTYLQSLAVNVLERHDVPKGYLDTLSTAKFSTWDAYQHQLDEVKPANEVDELKRGVSNLQDLMEMEHSMYHTSNQVLKLAIDAHHNEMQHASTNEQLKEFDDRLSIQEELKAFDKKAMEYEEIVIEAATGKNMIPNEEDCKVTNFPV